MRPGDLHRYDRPPPRPAPPGWYWNGQRFVNAAAERGPRVTGLGWLPYVALCLVLLPVVLVIDLIDILWTRLGLWR